MPSGSSAVPTAATPTTLVASLWPSRAGTGAALLRAALLAVLGSALLALSAKVQVPGPVPMTLQTLVVLVIGAAYGWRLGGATVLLYLAEGFSGLPVFAGAAAGPAYFAGPTGGFLLGFAAAAVAVGFLAERGWNGSLARIVALMALGHAVIFVFGLAWLATLVGPAKAWALGAAPFALPTLLKTALAAALLQAAWRGLPARPR